MEKIAVWSKDTGTVVRDMTADEQKVFDDRQTSWAAGSKDRKLKIIRKFRLEKLKSTDWMAVNDYSMPNYIKTWRQNLRDLPQDNTTESQYDTLLERNADGSLKNSVWPQPTS